MTPEHIANFRNVLRIIYGPLESLFTDEDIIAYRDKLQSSVDSIDVSDKPTGFVKLVKVAKSCSCDKSFHSTTIHLDGRVECNHCHKDR